MRKHLIPGDSFDDARGLVTVGMHGTHAVDRASAHLLISHNAHNK